MSWGRNQLPASMGVPRNANSGQSTDVGAAWALVTEDIRADASLKIFSNVEQIVPSINTSLVLPDPAHLQLKSASRAVPQAQPPGVLQTCILLLEKGDEFIFAGHCEISQEWNKCPGGMPSLPALSLLLVL